MLRADTIKLLNKTHPQAKHHHPGIQGHMEFKTDSSRIILTADKGVAMVVKDRQDHTNKAKELLGNQDIYRPIPKIPPLSLKTNSSKFSRTVNCRDRLTRPLTKDCILHVQSQPNFMDYPKTINKAPPQVHCLQQGFYHIWSSLTS